MGVILIITYVIVVGAFIYLYSYYAKTNVKAKLPTTRDCPVCQRKIRKSAKKCRHCKSDVAPVD